jgi:hypothetical protein
MAKALAGVGRFPDALTYAEAARRGFQNLGRSGESEVAITEETIRYIEFLKESAT